MPDIRPPMPPQQPGAQPPAMPQRAPERPQFSPQTPVGAPQPPPQPGKPPKRKRGDSWHSVFSTVLVLVLAPLIAVFLTMFVFQSYQVDGSSMETTLQNNDRLLVWKLPRSWAKITKNPYIPNRGDVVVFSDSRLGQFGQDPGKQLIKRVIGLPGDKVEISGGKVTVYNREHPNGFDPDKSLPYGNVIPATSIDGRWNVGEGQVFVMGDNRSNSLDSRLLGPIDANNIIGKLLARVLPVNKMKAF